MTANSLVGGPAATTMAHLRALKGALAAVTRSCQSTGDNVE